MKAVILTAGVGSRIRPLTDHTPKSLLKIGQKTILQRMIDNLLSSNINKICLITGYLEDQIKSFLKQTYPNLDFVYIRNNLFEQTNTAYSLNLSEPFIAGDSFIKFDADVVFENKILDKLIKDQCNSSLCIDKNIHLEHEEVKVEINPAGKVLKVGKKLDPKKASGESIGIEKISSDAGKVLFAELRELLTNPQNQQNYYDDVYTTLVERGIPFGAVDITGLKWVEIDTLEDYQTAQGLF